MKLQILGQYTKCGSGQNVHKQKIKCPKWPLENCCSGKPESISKRAERYEEKIATNVANNILEMTPKRAKIIEEE